MAEKTRALAMGVVAGLVGAVIVLAATVVIVAYTGAYNIAATEEHASVTRWVFGTTFHNSVERRAAVTDAPDAFDAQMVEAGAGEYLAMCEHCHGGPGADRSEWASGMRPRPPFLAEAAAEWAPAEVFWIVKHGAKMTGMPAFGPTHDDRELWNVVAFVNELPAMTPERYASFRDAGGQSH